MVSRTFRLKAPNPCMYTVNIVIVRARVLTVVSMLSVRSLSQLLSGDLDGLSVYKTL